MNVARTIAEMRRHVAATRRAGRTVALVPTMGALHAGHHSLIDAAVADGHLTAVSIFVNPTQFGPGEDLDRYPRTPEADLATCRTHGAALVFMPSVGEMYPDGPGLTAVTVAELPETLCGRSRPGHFAGVCTVVSKLLNIVQPDVAYFGAKDYQQATIIRRMVADLNMPVRIEVRPTVREDDGLAMSSRNANLAPEHRAQAPALHAALKLGETMIREDHPPADRVVAAVREHIAANAPAGEIDYVQVVHPDTLADVPATDAAVVIALAVRFPGARLIDNIRVEP